MNSYNDAGRAFWIEAYGGRPYSVDRKSRTDPILIPRLVVRVIGNIQPSRLVDLLHEADARGVASPGQRAPCGKRAFGVFRAEHRDDAALAREIQRIEAQHLAHRLNGRADGNRRTVQAHA